MALRQSRPLTSIEERIAELVAAGRTDAEVAVKLALTEKTVEWHLARAARKLGVRSRGELVAVLAGQIAPTQTVPLSGRLQRKEEK